MSKPLRGFYFITDARLSRRGAAHDVACAVRGGAAAVQYRIKGMDARAMLQEAAVLRELCQGGPPFIVNDRVDIALAVGAAGVHLGQDDLPCTVARRLLGPGAIIGVTVHSVEEAVQAERDGADYLGFGPVFATSTKLDARAPLGLGRLAEVRGCTRLPIVAVAGIDLARAPSVLAAGADAFAAVSATVACEDVTEAVRQLASLTAR